MNSNNIYSSLISLLKENKTVYRLTNLETGEDKLSINKPTENKKNEIIESIVTYPNIVSFGAGHIAKALFDIAEVLGYSFSVIDERKEFCNKTRFKNAEIFNIPYTALNKEKFNFISPYFVILTHGHKFDEECLEYCIKQNYSYLGMIGSKHKVAKTFRSLKEKGINTTFFSSVDAPIGLRIGAESPEEIALSIMGKIISVFRENKSSFAYTASYLDFASKNKGISVRIISNNGSTPRKKGSELFLNTKGEVRGTIGGGALELEALKRAEELLKQGESYYIEEEKLNSKGSLNMECGGEVRLLYQKR